MYRARNQIEFLKFDGSSMALGTKLDKVEGFICLFVNANPMLLLFLNDGGHDLPQDIMIKDFYGNVHAVFRFDISGCYQIETVGDSLICVWNDSMKDESVMMKVMI